MGNYRAEQEEHLRYEQWHKALSELFVGHILAYAAIRNPHGCALRVVTEAARDEGVLSYTFQELFDAACRISTRLRLLGIRARDRVCILIDNDSSFYTAYYGAGQLGAIVVPINSFLSSAEIAHIIDDAQPAAVIVIDSLVDKINDVQSSCIVVRVSELESCEVAPLESTAFEALAPDELAILLYTSGTTGVPKGVMISSGAALANVAQALARFDFIDHERVLCPLPLFHSFTQNTCVWASFIAGVTVILLSKITRTTLIVAAAQAPTVVLGIPALYGLLCRLPQISFSAVRYYVSGGEALLSNVRRYFALRFGRLLCNGYGLTEMGPVIAVQLEDCFVETHTIGQPLSGITYELRDCNAEGCGTLWVSGPNMMLGYYRAPEATAAVLKDGWLNTGDLALVDDAGRLVICGREKDLIVSKGIKIYPQEIETLLATHPTVVLAAVIGIKDEDGEYPVACIQVTARENADEETLHAYCRERLAAYKVPRRIIIMRSLPMTPTGKIDKKQLRKLNLF